MHVWFRFQTAYPLWNGSETPCFWIIFCNFKSKCNNLHQCDKVEGKGKPLNTVCRDVENSAKNERLKFRMGKTRS